MSLLPKVSTQHSSWKLSTLLSLHSSHLLSPSRPIFLLNIFHPFSLQGTQPTSVLSFPVLQPCSPHTQLLAKGGCAGYTICSSRSHFSFCTLPVPGKANVALWVLVGLGTTKPGGWGKKEVGVSAPLSPRLQLLSGGLIFSYNSPCRLW